MASPRRVEKVNVLIREVLAEILSREIQFPEGALVTVTRVQASEDLYYAYAFVSVLGAKDLEEETLELLKKETRMIQRALNRKLRMRPVPKITFAIDKDEKRRERIEKLLSEDRQRPDR